MISLPRVSADAARRLLLGGQGLLVDPARRVTPARVYQQIERMGFVQVDTISTVERAHHHILMSRFDGYRPRMLVKLLERDRRLFEHWTHDASAIPAIWLPYWRVRYERTEAWMRSRSYWLKRFEGKVDRTLEHVVERIESEGGLRSADFEHEGPRRPGGFWNWKPHKAALEFHWRSGRLQVARRDGFQKVYDLSERVFPGLFEGPPPDDAEYLDWACDTALERLGVATPAELAKFMDAVPNAAAKSWCREALARGEVHEVEVEAEDGSKPRIAVAHPDWERRAARLPEPPSRIRLLSPFDPIIRDRSRALRLFGFDYRFEAFVPEAKRQYGYYVLPLLERDRFIGRLDPKLHRERGVLEIRGLWWEPGVARGADRKRSLREAIECYAEQVGAGEIELTGNARRLVGAR